MEKHDYRELATKHERRPRDLDRLVDELLFLMDDEPYISMAADRIALALINAFDFDWGLVLFIEEMERRRQHYRDHYKDWTGEDVPESGWGAPAA